MAVCSRGSQRFRFEGAGACRRGALGVGNIVTTFTLCGLGLTRRLGCRQQSHDRHALWGGAGAAPGVRLSVVRSSGRAFGLPGSAGSLCLGCGCRGVVAGRRVTSWLLRRPSVVEFGLLCPSSASCVRGPPPHRCSVRPRPQARGRGFRHWGRARGRPRGRPHHRPRGVADGEVASQMLPVHNLPAVPRTTSPTRWRCWGPGCRQSEGASGSCAAPAWTAHARLDRCNRRLRRSNGGTGVQRGDSGPTGRLDGHAHGQPTAHRHPGAHTTGPSSAQLTRLPANRKHHPGITSQTTNAPTFPHRSKQNPVP